MSTQEAHVKTNELPPIADRLDVYLPRPEILEDYKTPRVLDQEKRARDEKLFPNATFALGRDHATGSFTISPLWHPINSSSPFNPGVHYSHCAFEGSSFLPVTDDNGEIIGANLILHESRIVRFKKSISSLGLFGFINDQVLQDFGQGLVDLASVSKNVFYDKDGNVVPGRRGYVRPWALRDDTSIGTAPKRTDFLSMGAFINSLDTYLAPEAYENGAEAAAFPFIRRDTKIVGKNAMNYGMSGDIGARIQGLIANGVKVNEGALFGPYWVDPTTGEKRAYDTDETVAFEQAMRGGLIVDGPGEDLVYFTSDGTLLYQPMDTNILAGTTRKYILEYLAPYLGIRTKEWPVNINDIRSGDVEGVAYTGNAVGFCGVKVMNITGPDNQVVEQLSFQITPEIRALTERFQQELTSQVTPTGPLLTAIDLRNGEIAREQLGRIYAHWIE